MDTTKIYDKVERIRFEKGYTRNRLCEEANISHSTFYNWRKKRTLPSLQILNNICEVLCIPIVTLFISDNVYKELTIENEILLDFFNKLPDSQKKAVLSLLKAMAYEK